MIALEAANEVERLRRLTGAALLDAGVPSPEVESTLAKTRRNVEAIDDALTEQVRRERDLQQRAQDEGLAHSRSCLQAAEARRLGAVSLAEKSARELAAALLDALEATAEIEMRLNQLDVRPRPTALALSEVERRLSARLAAVLTTVGNRPRFGTLPLKSRPGVNLNDGWLEAEARLAVVGLASILEPKEPTH